MLVISVGDYSGEWSKPWRDAGFTTLRVDPKLTAFDALDENDQVWPGTAQEFARYIEHSHLRHVVTGCLFAPPCTHFASSGAQYWAAKDQDGRTAESLEIIDACMKVVELCQPEWWMLENPVGRLQRLRPELGKPFYVQPHWFAGMTNDGERYTKKTGLWGQFDEATLKELKALYNEEPIRQCKQGSWVQQLGGSSERTKTLRSMTPQGLARATFMATHPEEAYR